MRNETYRSIGGERGEVSPALRGSEQLSEWRGGEASLMRRKAKHRWCGEIEVLPMLRLLQFVLISDNSSVADVEKSKRRRCSDHCDLFLSTMVQVGYQRQFKFYRRQIRFLRIVASFLLGSRWVWFFWEWRTEGLGENRKKIKQTSYLYWL